LRPTRKLKGNPRLSKGGLITDKNLERLCTELEEDGDASPDDVRAAVRRVYNSQIAVVSGKASPNPVDSAFLSIAFGRYLDGNLTFDQAFGVVRSRTGRPRVPAREQMKIAKAVWDQYLTATDSLGAAVTRVGDKIGLGKTQVENYFYEHFLASYISFVRYRNPKTPWQPTTAHENKRFSKVNKRYEKRARKSRSTPTEDAFTFTRNEDGTISVEGPWASHYLAL
jgi:hypothetical protein